MVAQSIFETVVFPVNYALMLVFNILAGVVMFPYYWYRAITDSNFHLDVSMNEFER